MDNPVSQQGQEPKARFTFLHCIMNASVKECVNRPAEGGCEEAE